MLEVGGGCADHAGAADGIHAGADGTKESLDRAQRRAEVNYSEIIMPSWLGFKFTSVFMRVVD